jgi:hypothetical protein
MFFQWFYYEFEGSQANPASSSPAWLVDWASCESLMSFTICQETAAHSKDLMGGNGSVLIFVIRCLLLELVLVNVFAMSCCLRRNKSSGRPVSSQT